MIHSRVHCDPLMLARIVPRAPSGQGPFSTTGTKVLLPNGEALPAVYSIELHCGAGDVWRATIRCFVQPPEVCVGAIVKIDGPLSWWRRALLRLAGVGHAETTSLDSSSREFLRIR